MGRVDNARIHRTQIRNAQFISFFSEQKCITVRNSDRHDQRLRRFRIVKTGLVLALAAGLAWVVMESAKAISMF
ncbi:hypothetical protein OpiT1DRAFT_01182 [Opitutaceae bacterium TAV1]|nr:hypothetical protein OPIT5_20560 [Opitutaceae bacterium TAV5]EIP96759.1 hypothetical protein OpiT1DRAFT_01182 [Opitutaceae bacterium TAV1]